MTTAHQGLFIILSAWTLAVSTVSGAEVLLHTSPPISTPASIPVAPLGQDGPPKVIGFQREFLIEQKLIASLPAPSSETVPLSAIEAIQLARKDVDPQGELRSLIVTELRLLRGPEKESHQIEYYLISMLGNGSETPRIVLMDGRVVSPRLRKIKG